MYLIVVIVRKTLPQPVMCLVEVIIQKTTRARQVLSSSVSQALAPPGAWGSRLVAERGGSGRCQLLPSRPSMAAATGSPSGAIAQPACKTKHNKASRVVLQQPALAVPCS